MRVLLAGAGGFLGTAWRDQLAREGHEVVRLVRGEAMSAGESHWDPYAGRVDAEVVERVDVVANLAGAALTHWPWTRAYRRTFMESRVATTHTLAEAVARSARRPALLAQSGIAGYGDHGDDVLTEESPIDADTFMGGVTRVWEQAAQPAAAAGARLVVMRTGVVLDRRGGALKLLRPAFLAGVGGPVGDGRQYLSTISLSDWVRSATWLARNDAAAGIYNVTGPEPTTNRELATELGRLLHRPARVPVPAALVRLAAGPVASELLSSTRLEPARLLREGFPFEHATLRDRLAAALA